MLGCGGLDPGWTLVLERDRRLERVHETLCTLADGHLGTRGDREEDGAGTAPMTVAAGVYDDRGGGPGLLAGPRWTGLELAVAGAERDRRVLDLRGGVLWRELAGRWGRVRTMRFASLARPGVVGLRAEGPAGVLGAGPPLCPPPDGVVFERGCADGVVWMRTRARCGGIVAAAWQHQDGAGASRVVERLAAYLADPDRMPPVTAAIARLQAARRAGLDRLLAEHRQAWAERWAGAAVAVDGDAEVELALRFGLFHLLSSVAGGGEAAVGARGLSGPAYAGHVFWDADVFVLPVLTATHPPAARAMLEYRLRRLDAARRLAKARGLEGARFPWESAADGTDVTPTSALDPDGRVVAIRTGELEEHIVADVAWAACRYAAWTGDRAFLDGPGRDLLLEGARYWASRARIDARGRAHIDGVIGPDEYHEDVGDNAFTNVMARWHLRQAAGLVEAGRSAGTAGTTAEAAAWRRLAAALVDGFDPRTGTYQQFAGFRQLEPLLISTFASPPVAADLLLGPARVRQAQVVKQADALMLHLLVPEETAPGSLGPNLAYYGPRTAHGSSLSPAVHAALLARAGHLDQALAMLEMACRLDLDDLTGTTAQGLHLANLGATWQALVHGFLGLDPSPRALRLDPRLAPVWHGVELRLRYHGRQVRLRAGGDRIDLAVDEPVTVGLPGLPPRKVTPPGTRYTRTGTTWQEQP